MGKFILALALLLPLSGSARMFPTEFPIKAICWDSIEESLAYHQEMMGEYPIGKGWIDSKDGPSFGAPDLGPWTCVAVDSQADRKRP